MMASLVMIACLMVGDGPCYRFVSIAAIPFEQCQALGGELVARWQEEHPTWRVAGWRCRVGARDTGEKDPQAEKKDTDT